MTNGSWTNVGKGMLCVAAAAALGVFVAPRHAGAHAAGGDPQTRSQQKCTNTMNKDATKVSKAANKVVQNCLKNFARGNPLHESLPSVDTLEECIVSDPRLRVATKKAKTGVHFARNCVGGDGNGFPRLPEYGVSTVAEINAGAVQKELDLVHDLFGLDLDAGAVVKESDPGDAADAAKCQAKVLRAVSKCAQERQKQFLKCKRNDLKENNGSYFYDLIYDSGDLTLCYDGIDANRLAKRCTGIPGLGLERDIQRHCADKVDDRTLSQLFPECGTDDPAALATCLDQSVRCRFCQAANSADAADRDCDLFDDGVADNDSCLPCQAAQGFATTYEAIQAVVFEGYGCTNGICHDSSGPQGDLDLTAGNSYAELVGVPSAGSSLDLVEPGEPALSFLYEKLSAATLGTPLSGGSPMPVGGALTEEHLEAVRLWIRGGAPEDLVVEGTALLLGSCLPEADPLLIPIPDPPGNGVGVQLRQTAWDLPAESEDEICMSTYYDLTGLVPAPMKVPCRKEFLPGRCTGGANNQQGCTVLADCPDTGAGTACDLTLGNRNNPSGECFAYKRTTLYQDPQSHHSIIHIYTGIYAPSHAGWGGFTYKFQDQTNPLQGQPCNPLAIDPAVGYNPDCSSAVVSRPACIGYGPPDYSQGGFTASGSSTAPAFSGSQEPFFDLEYPQSVYEMLPMQGVIVWNSHAFNLTTGDTTMSQYLNFFFADSTAVPSEQLHQVQAIFDAQSIFVQDVPAFETREYCRTYTIPPGAQLFYLSSHTHRYGVLWRTWAPPNTPCTPGQPACVPRGDTPVYLSTEYTDPLQLYFDPPVDHTGLSVNDRTYLYCSRYDNGSTPTSPPVKRRSTSPPVVVGGPCHVNLTRCIGGPNQGTFCAGADSVCDSVPGIGDGDCDACPVKGGISTEDEMFILIGGFYVP